MRNFSSSDTRQSIRGGSKTRKPESGAALCETKKLVSPSLLVRSSRESESSSSSVKTLSTCFAKKAPAVPALMKQARAFDRRFWTRQAQEVILRFELDRCQKERFENFEILTFLSRGSFGSVYRVRHKRSHRIYAMKVQPKRPIVRKNVQKYATQEKRIFGAVNFKFIVKLVFAFKDNANLFLVMEYVENGDFQSILRQEKKLSEWRSKIYVGQLVLALEYLHRAHIIFRDLKPPNVLVAQDGYLKLSDFGLSTVTYGYATTLCGTPAYMAPEIVRRYQYGAGVDWWALGILCYEMLHGRVPFQAPQNGGTLLEKLILTAPVEFCEDMSREAEDLISKLLERNVARRLGGLHNGVDDILEHPWFRDMSYEMLYAKKYKIDIVPQPRIPQARERIDPIQFDAWDHYPNDFLNF